MLTSSDKNWIGWTSYYNSGADQIKNCWTTVTVVSQMILLSQLIPFLRLYLKEYQGSSVLGQFVTRFLLRETTTQLHSLQSSLDCAMEAVHDQGCTGRRIVKKPADLPIQRMAKRPGRRIQKNMCLSPTDPYSGMLTTGTFQGNGNRMREVILIKFDWKIKIESSPWAGLKLCFWYQGSVWSQTTTGAPRSTSWSSS